MKYTKEQIENHFKWAANNEAPMANKWIDWCAESMFIIQEILKENERYRAALIELAIAGEIGMKPDPQDWLTFHDKVAKIAREALKGEE